MKLTVKQESYVQGLIEGLSQREAYRQAGYSVDGKTDEYLDVRASELFKNSKVLERYNQLIREHQEKSLWTREEAIHDLKWLKEQSKDNIKVIGVKQANSNAMLNAIKELNELEDLYPKQNKDNTNDNSEVAEALRGLADGINKQTE